MSIAGYSIFFRGRLRTSDGLSGRLSHVEIAPDRVGSHLRQSRSDHPGQLSIERSGLKQFLSDRAHLGVTHSSSGPPPVFFALSDEIPSDSRTPANRPAHIEISTRNVRPTSQRAHRSHIKVPLRPNEVSRNPGTDRNGQKQASAKKPSIVVVHPRAFSRDCFVRCLEFSYKSHDILAFAGISEWRSSEDQTSPSVIVFFVDGKNSSSADDLQFLESAAIDIPVVIMSDIDDANYVMRALKSGARGYIPTSLPFNVAVEAVRLVEAGGTFVPVSSLELGRDVQEACSKSTELFTERQMMVVEALCQGMANKKIAYELGMSEHTVKVHLRHIMRKLKVRNRTEVAVLTKDFFGKENGQRWPIQGNGDPKDFLPS